MYSGTTYTIEPWLKDCPAAKADQWLSLCIPLMWSETVGLRKDRSETKQSVLVLILVLQVWCYVLKHRLLTLVVIMILDTATFQILFRVSLFWFWNISTVKTNRGVHLFKSLIRQVPLFASGGLGLKNLVLFTSQTHSRNVQPVTLRSSTRPVEGGVISFTRAGRLPRDKWCRKQ